MAPSFSKPPRLSFAEYLLVEKERFRVETLDYSDRVPKSVECKQCPVNTAQREYGRLPDISRFTPLHNHLGVDYSETLLFCTSFQQLGMACCEQECINLLHKLLSNATAIESFFQKFKTFDLKRHKLHEKMKMSTPHSSFKKEVSICQNNVGSTLHCRGLLTVLRELVAQCSSHEFLHSLETSDYFPHPSKSENGKEACPAVERYIEASPDISVSWNESQRKTT